MFHVLCFRHYACPMLLPHQRPPRPRSRKVLLMKQQPYHHHQHNNSIYSDDSSSGTITPSLCSNSRISTPQQPLAHNPIVSGTSCQLVDGLTRFFTPSDKRKSRVSLNSYSCDVVSRLLTAAAQRQSQRAANKLVRRSRVMQAVRGRRENRGGEIDGISHLFTACRGQPLGVHGDSRRGVQMYGSQSRGRRCEQGGGEQWTQEQGMGERMQAGSKQSGGQRRSSDVTTPGCRGYSGAVVEGKSPCSCLHATHTRW